MHLHEGMAAKFYVHVRVVFGTADGQVFEFDQGDEMAAVTDARLAIDATAGMAHANLERTVERLRREVEPGTKLSELRFRRVALGEP